MCISSQPGQWSRSLSVGSCRFYLETLIQVSVYVLGLHSLCDLYSFYILLLLLSEFLNFS